MTTSDNPAAATPVSPLSAEELHSINAYWRACTYLATGMIYLRDNPLLKEPLKPDHIKNRLLGHWGSSPGLSFAYIHMNRLINKYGLDAIFMAGPGLSGRNLLGNLPQQGRSTPPMRQHLHVFQGLIQKYLRGLCPPTKSDDCQAHPKSSHF